MLRSVLSHSNGLYRSIYTCPTAAGMKLGAAAVGFHSAMNESSGLQPHGSGIVYNPLEGLRLKLILENAR